MKRLLWLALVLGFLVVTVFIPGYGAATDTIVFFGADGMRPDLMEKYMAEGAMSTYQDLVAKGIKGDNGLVQAFPPNTGVGWYTLADGYLPVGAWLDQQHLLPHRRYLWQPYSRIFWWCFAG